MRVPMSGKVTAAMTMACRSSRLALLEEAVLGEWLFIIVDPCCDIGIRIRFNVSAFQSLALFRQRTARLTLRYMLV